MLISKRRKLITEKIEPLKAYPLEDAINLLISLPKVKFNESSDISINLGVDSDKSDQNVRGSSSLPHGIGKISKVAVFAEGPDADAAKKHLKSSIEEPLKDLAAVFETITWDSSSIHEAIDDTCKKHNIGFGKIGQPLRVAVTGITISPPIDITLTLVEKEVVIQSLKSAIE